MSSWKKAAKSNQKVHRERHQPDHRSHLGLLEKKSDYRKRARNAERKARTLQMLHRRALNKNPDEFYHHMVRSRMQDGVHRELERDSGDEAGGEKDESTKEQLALMETQDLKYVIMKRTVEAQKIKRLQAQLHMIDRPNSMPNEHKFFLDTEGDEDPREIKRKLQEFDLASRLETHPDVLARRTNRPRLQDLEKMDLPDMTEENVERMKSLREQSYRELAKRIEREKQLAIVQAKLEIKRKLHQPRLLKPKRKKAGTKDAPPVYKFQYERKK